MNEPATPDIDTDIKEQVVMIAGINLYDGDHDHTMSKLCPNCFYENNDTAQVCEVCGTKLTAAGEGDSVGSAQHVDLITPLKRMRLGFVLLVALSAFSIAFSIFIYFYSGFFSILAHVEASAAQGTHLTLSMSKAYHSFVDYYIIDLSVSAVIVLLIYGLIAVSFSDLKKVNHEYSSGFTGTIMLMVSEVAVFILVVVFILTTYSAILNGLNGSSSPSQNLPSLGLIFGLVGGLLILVILAIVGIILFTIGVYRVGRFFDNSLIRAGAIINIFIPFVGAALVIYGLTEIINRLQNPGTH